ncbi:hypothetical protein K1T71_002837 [Dendrolimus kikuchii]|uniref:Uncharacterized protein n=1 Tax=Dendrolimus kikuchii TaxID=765133 RepID=A0ACC1DE23_9NEOP|nr:hypothetical protein K1T71_002837 [Dendrolimus kikuchii]
MEAVPKLPLINFELKTSPENTHFGPKLKQYIAEAYREDPDSYSNEIHQLESLRSAAVRPTSDSTGLSAMIKYFCQLKAIQSRFPMVKGQPVAVTFTWKDLYAGMNCPLADIRFEMACILYNIGALHTQLGSSEPRTSADSMKAACTHYQNAAWAFQYLREQYPQLPGVDVCPEIMKLLQEMCFAQAQECILEKSIQDTRKPSVVGAVATQVLFFYKNSIALLGSSTGSDNIHEIIGTKLYNYWYRFLSFKASYIGCIICLYQGMHAEEQQKMGERVAFYQQAVEKLAEARKLAKYIEPTQVTLEALTFTNDVVEGKRKAAKNENEFIYHEEVPDKDLLMDMKPVCLVKALAFNFTDPEVAGPDIFSRLVPMGAHEASSLYSEEKAKLLRSIVSKAEEKNTELTEFMSSLQLEQLNVLDSEQKIPQEIVDRCAAMNAKVEIIQTLVESMNNLAEIINDVEHSLAEVKTLVQEETLKEKEYQRLMGPRPPSIVQTELSRELHKYQEAHARTHESNQVLHKAMTLHISNLKLLAQPLDVLMGKIPSIENIEGLDRETMTQLSRVVGKVRDMQTQRDSLIQQLREAVTSDDITTQLLTMGPNEPLEPVFNKELEKHKPTVNIIEQNLLAQENIINKVTSLYAAYGESRRLLTEMLRKREALINALITSYDAYQELLAKSQKGQEFYKKLLQNVNQLLARVRSTCQVQQEERAQMLANQGTKASTPTPLQQPVAPKTPEVTPTMPTSGGGRKLKDYLPYMKNRNMPRSVTPQAQVEQIPADTYYPEGIYPTSVRPAPVGSEATDVTQMQLPDGVVMPMQIPYDRYTPYAPTETNPYAYPATSKPYDKPEEMYSSFTPQFSSQISEQTYSNPYYSATLNNGTVVTDSQNSMYSNQSNQQYGNNNSTNSVQYLATTGQNQHMNMGQPPSNQFINNAEQNTQYPGDMNLYPGQVNTYSANASQVNPQYTGNASNSQYPTNPSHANSQYQISVCQGNTQYPVAGQSNLQYAVASQTNLQYPVNASPAISQYSTTSQGNAQQFLGSTHHPDAQYPVNASQSQVSTEIMPNASNTNVTYLANPNQVNQYPGSIQTSQYMYNDPYGQSNQMGPISNAISSMSTYSEANQTDLSSNFAQMQITGPKSEPSNYGQEHSQTYYMQYSQGSTANVYNSGQNSTAPSQMPSDYSTINYPYSSDPTQLSQNQVYSATDAQYNFASTSCGNASQSYPTYTNANSAITSTTSISNTMTSSQGYNNAESESYINPALSQLDAFDTPIKSHVTGEALTSINYTNFQNYDASALTKQDQNYPNNLYNNTEQSNVSYAQGYQNHPGYTFNSATGNYEYNYGSQNSYRTVHSNIDPQVTGKDANWNAPVVYTSAGQCETVQSPSEESQRPIEGKDNQTYYNAPYGYQTITNQANEVIPNSQVVSTNYGANVNQSTYMQSGHCNDPETNVTFASNQVSSPKEKAPESPSFEQKTESKNETPEPKTEKPVENEPVKQEPSVFDLLSEIDFSVEQKPLMPEIKVPQISESMIKKPVNVPKIEPIKPPKEEVIERPAKRDLFSDPSLLNKFTQEVKNLQKLVDSLTNKLPSGLTLLDSKWKTFQDVQTKENMTRSKTIAMQHTSGNIVTEVVPFDDSRLKLKSDPDAYINASYYKQLASWCIPLVISKNPSEDEYSTFWKAVLENKILCLVCLLSEIEMQGKSYWPTAKGQSLDLTGNIKVILDEVTCNVHWTERKLTVASGKTVLTVTHYQINVFPAKIVCSPLVLLADKILGLTYDSRLSNQLGGAWVQCCAGAGRSAVLVLLIMVMCQVRAGQLDLCDMLDAGCINLYKHRSNVLEDTKFLADAYRTALFYVQGVLCSGTTMFNGEAVSVPSGAAVLPPVTPTPSAAQPSTQKTNKFSRESFEEMKQSPGLKSGDMKDPLNFLDPLWSLKKK